jgi:flagellar hook-associated protein 1 FlgK
MSGLFQGLEVGKRALLTHQLTMNTIGHNLANVNTPGYTRQRTLVTSANPNITANYIIGNGVTARNINQVRDLFLTTQYRRENKRLGEWEYREKSLTQIEAFFAEPNNDSMGDVLNKFWTSWMDLSNNPESSAARSAVVAQSNTLANSFHSLNRQLSELQTSANEDVKGRVNEINLIAGEIANLNRLVTGSELGGQKANDLRDQRDYLIDGLSKLVDVTTREKANGSVNVYISGLAIVENADVFAIDTIVNSAGDQAKYDIVWKNTGTTVKINGGELKGLLDTRDLLVPQYRDQLDQMASTIIREVNELHRAGIGITSSGGLNFFNSAFTTASTIRVEQNIINDPSLIAASLSGGPGDNANALAIGELRSKMAMSFGTMTINDFYNSMIGNIGIDTHEAITFKGNFEVLIHQIENSRQSVQGVSLDEEMAEMMRMQHAYDAAARLITYIDDALDTVIHGMGIVGR